MQILGIDPGYATTGFGVVQSLPGTLKLLNYGTITTPAAMKFPQRLEMLYDDMVRLLDTVKPDAVAVEELFWATTSRPASASAMGAASFCLPSRNPACRCLSTRRGRSSRLWSATAAPKSGRSWT